ncbi:MAG: hypothetical protein AAF713_22230 [Pseudomonadota bacterium]
MIALALTTTLVATAAPAWQEPPRGSETRSAMMDAVRPFAESDMGAPVIFIVRDLRVEGNLGFASLDPIRPGGGTAGERVHALYQRSSVGWSVADWSVGATEEWWSAPEICAVWQSVIPEFCEG